MSLAVPPTNRKKLSDLVNNYNAVPGDDKVQQLFYLQKINFELNTLEYDEGLYNWVYDKDEDGWQQHLLDNDIHPYGSFLIRTYQFAQAIAKHIQDPSIYKLDEVSLLDYRRTSYKEMQKRDALFESGESYENCAKQYICHSLQLNNLSQRIGNSTTAKEDATIYGEIQAQLEILEAVQDKIDCIIYPNMEKISGKGYQTELLGTPVNNYNFKFRMNGYKEDFIFRVEMRESLEEISHFRCTPYQCILFLNMQIYGWLLKIRTITLNFILSHLVSTLTVEA